MLDLLARYDAKCTFFVIGDKARQYPGLLTRMTAEGHTVGNHTYTHLNPKRATRKKLLEELETASRAIEEIIGARPALFRPPYGDFPKNEPTVGGMRVVFWSVDSRDWSSRDPELILEQTLPDVQDGSIIIMHDIYESTLEATEILLEELTAQGYIFVTAETLLAMTGQ
jgi:peptidoglycan/xylan/chitin deacetylase (PgdA/CDA1 family)